MKRWDELACSFCGKATPGGVRGPDVPGPRLYICPDCIRSSHDQIHDGTDTRIDGEPPRGA